jgi:hypothetical protein
MNKRRNQRFLACLPFKKMLNKRGIVSEYLPWILIAVAVLVILLVAAFFLREQGVNLIDQIKNVFTGG